MEPGRSPRRLEVLRVSGPFLVLQIRRTQAIHDPTLCQHPEPRGLLLPPNPLGHRTQWRPTVCRPRAVSRCLCTIKPTVGLQVRILLSVPLLCLEAFVLVEEQRSVSLVRHLLLLGRVCVDVTPRFGEGLARLLPAAEGELEVGRGDGDVGGAGRENYLEGNIPRGLPGYLWCGFRAENHEVLGLFWNRSVSLVGKSM